MPKVLFSVFLFNYIFTPGFRLININIVLYATSFLYIILNYKGFLIALRKKHVIHFISLILITFFYTLLIQFSFNSKTSSHFRSHFWFQNFHLLAETVLIILPICVALKKLKFNLDDLLKSFLLISLVQSIFAIILFINPSVKDFVFNHIIDLDYYFADNNENINKLIYLRLNGLGSELTFAMSLFQGFIIILLFNFYKVYRKKYLIYIPIIIISMLLNARVGLFFILSYFIYLIIEGLIKLKFSKLLVLLILQVFFILFLVFLVFHYFKEFYAMFSVFLFSGFSDGAILPHQDTLLNEHLFFPGDLLGVLFGNGKYVFSNSFELLHSDIGYVNILMFGGVILQFLLFFIYLYPIFILRNKGPFYKLLLVQLVIALFLIQLKGNVFYVNGLTKSLILFGLYFSVFQTNKNNLVE